MSTEVVNLYKDTFDVYIGRAGRGFSGYFGNPFPLINESKREECLEKYRGYFYTRLREDLEFFYKILELEGKRLACFCKPNKFCHGDIIADFVDNKTERMIENNITWSLPNVEN